MSKDNATSRQVEAADPSVSTWLSANAGSGKTRVLTDRVARLLLKDVSPQNILCLTYTKAAASEMQNRLFKRLGEWAMLGDETLLRELTKLGANVNLTGDGLARARTLFARAIETPGGLRIQTIHSFCASLLRRFPLEAGVSPVFREMEDRAAKILRENIVEQISVGPAREVMEGIAQHYTGDDFSKLTSEIVRHRDQLGAPRSQNEIWEMFGLSANIDKNAVLKHVFLGGEAPLMRKVIGLLLESTKSSDVKAGNRLTAVNFETPSEADLETLFSVFLYGANANVPFGAKLSSFPTKGIRDANPEILTELREFMQRVETGRVSSVSLNAARKTFALYQFSNVFLPAYEAHKETRGWLDFDDLIRRAGSLLSDPAVAQWVLFRLDGGIDHILVDEAQDTSPQQWRVIKLLAQEFAAGKGARSDIERTIFVVGDLKQSIYSFQGADPLAFNRMRDHFAASIGRSDAGFFERSLTYSFRSSPAILDFVDATFDKSGGHGVGGPPVHHAFFSKLPGRVDLWPIVPKESGEELREWFDPADMLARNDHKVILAEKIAAQIQTMQREGSIPAERGFRPIQFSDFLILVQSRSALFYEIIRACKARNLPMAGADRIKIGAELAVKDLVALLSFLSLPDDSLSLAAALRSPIFAVSENALFELAHDRGDIGLWPALVRQKSAYPEAYETLSALLDQVDYLNPFDLLECILTKHHARERLLARLGPESEDEIDALFTQAINYERSETPSLTGFLVWLAADEIEIKRQSDNIGDRIRVMTTHGAKGLESAIVILPDTGDRIDRQSAEVLLSESGSAMWRTKATHLTPEMTDAVALAKSAQSKEKQRLLYVALTRAEKWLIVCSSGDIKPDGTSWYRQAEAGIESVGAIDIETPAGPGLRYQTGVWQDVDSTAIGAEEHVTDPLPVWATTNASAPKKAILPLSPSRLGGAKTLGGGTEYEEDVDALKRGRQVHLLLEHLPKYAEQNWASVANSLLSSGSDLAADQDRKTLLNEASRVLRQPALAEVFSANALTEVEFTAAFPVGSETRINGVIDRLIVTPSLVRVIDFKSNRTVPQSVSQVPVGILQQMAAYLSAVEQLYPERSVELCVLWTHTASVMVLPHDIVRASLDSTPHLDDHRLET